MSNPWHKPSAEPVPTNALILLIYTSQYSLCCGLVTAGSNDNERSFSGWCSNIQISTIDINKVKYWMWVPNLPNKEEDGDSSSK